MVVCSISWKFWPNRWFFVLFHEKRHFFQLFPEQFIEMQRHGSFFEKLQSFGQIDGFSNKLPCFGVLMNFSAKGWKKCLISWKSTKSYIFGENLQLFEQTTMFWHFHELFSKKLQKEPHLVKKHEKSWIWQKLFNFFNKIPCFCILMTF